MEKQKKQKKQKKKSFLQRTWVTDNRATIKTRSPLHERSVIDFDMRILTQLFRSKK